jgi:hypothetical protein
MAQYPRRPLPSYLLPWEPEILYSSYCSCLSNVFSRDVMWSDMKTKHQYLVLRECHMYKIWIQWAPVFVSLCVHISIQIKLGIKFAIVTWLNTPVTDMKLIATGSCGCKEFAMVLWGHSFNNIVEFFMLPFNTPLSCPKCLRNKADFQAELRYYQISFCLYSAFWFHVY